MTKIVKNTTNNYVTYTFKTIEAAIAYRLLARGFGMKADPYYEAKRSVRVYQ